MITKATIDKILDILRVEEIVNDFVSLKKRGVNYLGLCPFHDEKTPSFSVSPSKGIFKCFGCGKGGDAITFLMEHEHYTYPEALKYIAAKYNIEIEEKLQTPEEQIQHNERESIYIALTYALNYFSDSLIKSELGKSIGLSYLKERGIKPEMISKFSLGYSLPERNSFYKSAVNASYKPDILEKAGLIIKTKSGDYIDRYNDRIIFPIFSMSGRVIGFGGRILKNNAKEAKYINSPETIVYNKSKVLFGLNLAKTEIVKNNKCYLVEGYTDVISMHQAGIENVVAVSGTSLTIDQISIIRRFTDNLIFLLDSDKAGTEAAMRGIDLALKGGMNAFVIQLPEGEDPDSFVSKSAKDSVLEYFENYKEDFIKFKYSVLLKGEKENPQKKVIAAREIVNSIANIPEMLVRSEYIKYSSKLLSIDESALTNELNKAIVNKNKEEKRDFAGRESLEQEKPDITEKGTESSLFVKSSVAQENVLIRLLMAYGNLPYDENKTVALKIIEGVKEFGIQKELHNKIIEDFLCSMENNITPALDDLIKHENEEIRNMAIDLSLRKYQLSKNWNSRLSLRVIELEKNYKNEVKTVLIHFKLKKVLELLEENKLKLKETSDKNLEEHLKVQAYLLDMKRKLSDELKTVVI